MGKSTTVKLIWVKSEDTQKGEDEINALLDIGFELYGSPTVVDTRFLYTLTKAGEKEYIRFSSTYPTAKQYGYLCWAYQCFESDLAKETLSKEEASKLISLHKDTQSGEQYESGEFVKQIGKIRGDSGTAQHGDPEEFDDEDVPF